MPWRRWAGLVLPELSVFRSSSPTLRCSERSSLKETALRSTGTRSWFGRIVYARAPLSRP